LLRCLHSQTPCQPGDMWSTRGGRFGPRVAKARAAVPLCYPSGHSRATVVICRPWLGALRRVTESHRICCRKSKIPERFSGVPAAQSLRPILSRTPGRKPGVCLPEKTIGHIELRVRTDRTGPSCPDRLRGGRCEQ